MNKPYVNYVEDHSAETWRKLIGSRATALGDQYAIQGGVPPHAGSAVIPVGNLPVTSGSPDTAPALFTTPGNLIFGVYKDIVIKPWDYPRERSIYFSIYMRLACAVEQENAAAKITNLKAE
jgi:hypothetical protein